MKQMMLVVVLCIFLVSCTETSEIKKNQPIEEELTENKKIMTNTHQVIAEYLEFTPGTLEINLGDTIEWINKESEAHTVTLENGEFDQIIPPGGIVTWTATKKGEYRYFCQFHPVMQGKIFVK